MLAPCPLRAALRMAVSANVDATEPTAQTHPLSFALTARPRAALRSPFLRIVPSRRSLPAAGSARTARPTQRQSSPSRFPPHAAVTFSTLAHYLLAACSLIVRCLFAACSLLECSPRLIARAHPPMGAAFFALHPKDFCTGSKNAHAAVCAALYVTALCVGSST